MILAEQTAEARAHLVGVDLVEPPDQLDDARPDGALGAGAAARRRAHPPREPPAPRHRRRPRAATRGAAGAAAQGLAPLASRARYIDEDETVDQMEASKKKSVEAAAAKRGGGGGGGGGFSHVRLAWR